MMVPGIIYFSFFLNNLSLRLPVITCGTNEGASFKLATCCAISLFCKDESEHPIPLYAFFFFYYE